MSLHNLARDGLIDELRLQIAQGRDVNVTDSMKRTPLILAAHRGHLEAVQTLLRAGADASKLALDGFSALHFAAQAGHADCVSLIAKKCKSIINAKITKDHKTALHLACLRGHLSCVEALLQAGADVTMKTSGGQTALELVTDKNSDIKSCLEGFFRAKEEARLAKLSQKVQSDDVGDENKSDDESQKLHESDQPNAKKRSIDNDVNEDNEVQKSKKHRVALSHLGYQDETEF